MASALSCKRERSCEVKARNALLHACLAIDLLIPPIRYGVAPHHFESHSGCTQLVSCSACFCCILAHLKTVCAFKMAVNHFIQWHYEVRDCLRQIGVSRSYVHLAVWQMRQRLMTWGPCRVKESLRHANKSLLFPLEMRCVSEKTIIEFHSDTCFKDTLYTSMYCNSLSTHLSATGPSVCSCKPLTAVLKHGDTFDSCS